MDRREFAALLAGSLLAKGSCVQPAGKRRRKNVLLLMSDQHRPAALSINGNTPARTPNLDQLARAGVRFDDAYCTTPVCAPSRASLMTGLWTHNHGAVSNDAPLPYKHKTLAHYFGDQDYVTGLIGKMHFVDAQTHGFDYRLDFNDWMEYLGPKAQIFADEIGNRASSGSGLPEIDDLWKDYGNPWAGRVADDGRRGLLGLGGVDRLEERDQFESFVTRESIRFLKRFGNGPEPFFLICSYLKPHDPFFPAQRFYLQFLAENMKLPETYGRTDTSAVPPSIRESIRNPWIMPELNDSVQKAKEHIALYYASLMQMDDNVGKMLQALKDLGLEDNTVVLYTSDHGEMLGEHGLWQKTVFYEQSAGVPLIVRAPGVTGRNKRCATPVSLVSVPQTLMDLCDVPIPSGLDGESLVNDLRKPETRRDTTVFSEYGLRSTIAKAMIRRGSFKYTAYAHETPDELYDLSTDPEEMNNLALQSRFAEKAVAMKAELFAWHQPA